MDVTVTLTISHERMAELAEVLASFEAGQVLVGFTITPEASVSDVQQEQPEAGDAEGATAPEAPPVTAPNGVVVELSWLHRQKVPRLKELAAANGVVLPPKATKDAIIDAIVEATSIPGTLDDEDEASPSEDEGWGDEASDDDDGWGDEEDVTSAA